MTMSPSILAVIVLYNENLFSTKTYRSLLLGTTIHIFVYDNSMIAQHEADTLPENITYVHDSNNSGLSKAYNTAAKFASLNFFDWILLLDQDTTFPHNALKKYWMGLETYKGIYLFAPIIKICNQKPFSPTRQILKRAQAIDNVTPGYKSLNHNAPVNSGIIVNTASFLEAGGYNEKVVLDFSDYQFIERFRKKHQYFYVLDIICSQEFSNVTKNKDKLIRRFAIFCDCARECKRNNFIDSICYFAISLRRLLSLFIRTKRLALFNIYINHYIFKKTK